ncbi:MAG: hypothetical protein ACOCP8_02055 [archaeon]
MITIIIILMSEEEYEYDRSFEKDVSKAIMEGEKKILEVLEEKIGIQHILI